MKNSLNREESALLARIEATEKWDALLYYLSVMVPSFIVVGVGLWHNSRATIVIGLCVYAFFAVRTPLVQAKTVPVMKSLVSKLVEENRCAENVPSEHCDSLPSGKGAGGS